jgi:hypothetical protein
MRAFHCSWLAFFIAPLLSEIRTTLGLSKQQIWTSSTINVDRTIVMRLHDVDRTIDRTGGNGPGPDATGGGVDGCASDRENKPPW